MILWITVSHISTKSVKILRSHNDRTNMENYLVRTVIEIKFYILHRQRVI